MAARVRENSRWPLFFFKLYMSIAIRKCTDRSNPLRIGRDAIFKVICNSRGNTPPPPPHNIQLGDASATLPNRNGRYQGTTCTTWLYLYTPCISQPISLPYHDGSMFTHRLISLFLILSILVFLAICLRHLIFVVVNICLTLLARVQFSPW